MKFGTKIQNFEDKKMSDGSFRNIKLFPPNTFVFSYYNKHDVLVTNMVSKLINGF